MILAVCLESSYFSLSLGKLSRISRRVKGWLSRIYSNSLLNKISRLFWEGMKINFKNSSIARIASIGFRDYSSIIENSRFISTILEYYKKYKVLIRDYMKASIIANSAAITKKDPHLYSLKTGGAIIITALFTNLFFSILIGKKIEIFGFFILSLVLFISLGGIFCTFNRGQIKEESTVIKYIKSCCKTKNYG